MRYATLRLLPLLALLATSCAGMRVTDTGFLPDYDQLRPAPEKQVRFIPDEVLWYENPDVDWEAYERVHVEPVAWRRVADRPHTELTEAEASKLTGQFRRRLREAFAQEYEPVDVAGPGTLVVRAALTDVDHQIPWINWIGLALVVPPDMGGLSGEVEILDGASRERLLAMAAHRDGSPFLVLECFSRFGHAKHGMKKWSKLLLESVRD